MFPALTARPDRAPQHPVVFCHGLLGFDTVSLGPAIAPLQVSHWRGIREALEANGARVLVTRVPATSTPVERAKVLAAAIAEKLPGEKVHLVGGCPFCDHRGARAERGQDRA
jgi:triacylglycerol lipase